MPIQPIFSRPGMDRERRGRNAPHLEGVSLPSGIEGRRGFTLIELMLVTLIIGLLAAIAIPRLSRVQERAHFATIGNDLRNLGASQERYYQANVRYAMNIGELDFVSSQGVEVEVIEASISGWAAWATHAALEEGKGCSLYLGSAAPPPLPNGQPHGGGSGVIRCVQ